MGWEAAWIVLCVIVVLCLPLVALYTRRRWLSSRGGLFDCALRLGEGSPGTGWALGMARYRGEALEWFRAFSPTLRPRITFLRGVTFYDGRRSANGVEAVVLFDETQIVTLRDRFTRTSHELAMSEDSVMGLLSWLESAPPGSHYRPGSNDSPL